MRVAVLNTQRRPADFQRIYMPLHEIEKRKICLGSSVMVNFQNGSSVICRAFVDNFSNRDFIKLSPVVTSLEGFDLFPNGSGLTVEKIETPLETQYCKDLKIKLITSNVRSFITFKNDIKRARLQEIFRDLLEGVCIKHRYFVNLTNHPVAQVYNIAGMTIESIDDQSSCHRFVEFRLSNNANIIVSSVISKDRYTFLSEIDNSPLDKKGGLKSQTLELSNVLSSRSRKLRDGVLLHGPSGSGKYTCLKKVCRIYKAFLMDINCCELLRSREGESEEAIRNLFYEAQLRSREGLTVLFMRGIDIFNGTGESEARIMSSRCSVQIVSILDDILRAPALDLVIVASSSNAINVDRSLRRAGRLGHEVSFGVPTYSDRLDILKHLMPESDNAEWLAESTPGYLPSDLELLTKHAERESSSRKEYRDISKEDLLLALKSVPPSGFKSGLGHVRLHDNDGAPDLESIGGLEEVKSKINRAIRWPLEHPEAFVRMGLKAPRGVLLYGPPGCGKTTLVRAFAKAGTGNKKVTFLSVSGASIFSPFVGDSEKNVVEIFRKARLAAPSILFIDEIDTLVCKRGQKSKGDVQERILAAFLNEMDGLENSVVSNFENERAKELLNEEYTEEDITEAISKKRMYDLADVFVIGATNRPEVLDAALVRPGRLDHSIYIPLPDLQGRLDILKTFTKKMPLTKDVDLESLALRTDNFSGADLESLCREAALQGLTLDGLDGCDNISSEHFSLALDSFRPSITKEMLYRYEQLNAKIRP